MPSVMVHTFLALLYIIYKQKKTINSLYISFAYKNYIVPTHDGTLQYNFLISVMITQIC